MSTAGWLPWRAQYRPSAPPAQARGWRIPGERGTSPPNRAHRRRCGPPHLFRGSSTGSRYSRPSGRAALGASCSGTHRSSRSPSRQARSQHGPPALRRGRHLADRPRPGSVRGCRGRALQPADPRHRRRVRAHRAASRRSVRRDDRRRGRQRGVDCPALVGSGSDMTARLLAGTFATAAIPVAFAVRYALGAVSHSAFTPGGLFAPLLLLGAQLGLLCGTIARVRTVARHGRGASACPQWATPPRRHSIAV
jgi:Voltage gated chloride channel